MLGLLLLWGDNANANEELPLTVGVLMGAHSQLWSDTPDPVYPTRENESQTGVNVNKGYKNRRLLTLHKTSNPNSAAIV